MLVKTRAVVLPLERLAAVLGGDIQSFQDVWWSVKDHLLSGLRKIVLVVNLIRVSFLLLESNS